MRWRWTLLPVVLFVLTPSSAGAAGGGGCHEVSEGAGDARAATVEMVDACFTPTVLRVDEGTTVTFVNRDQMLHNVAAVGWGWGDVDPGGQFSQLFDAAGTYVYACYLHPSMSGVVIVGDGAGSGPVVPVAAVETETIAAAAAVPEPAPPPAAPDPEDGGVATAVAVGIGVGALVLGFGARSATASWQRRATRS